MSGLRSDLNDLTDEQVRDLAQAYLNLMGLMLDALEQCDTQYGFYSWSGRGFNITGHPPEELVAQILSK